MLGKAFVYIATICHSYDVNNEFIIPDLVENPEGTLADPVTRMFARELFAAMRSRILCECLNPLNDTLTRFLLTD